MQMTNNEGTKLCLIILFIIWVKFIHCLSTSQRKFNYEPSFLIADSLTHSYPETIFSNLFSSVPKRTLAVNKISLKLKPGIYQLLGASSSGKSTLIRFLAGIEKPNQGSVYVNDEEITLINPIDIITSKPDFNDSLSVKDRLMKIAFDSNSKDNKDCIPLLVDDLSEILEMNKQMLNKKPSFLTPSEQYIFGMACNCLQCINFKSKDTIFAPILFFDELFDFEHSSIPLKLSNPLLNLVEIGSIIIIATHKPQQLKSIANRVITLSAGEILNDISLQVDQ